MDEVVGSIMPDVETEVHGVIDSKEGAMLVISCLLLRLGGDVTLTQEELDTVVCEYVGLEEEREENSVRIRLIPAAHDSIPH